MQTPLAFWPLNDQTTVNDQSPNQLHLTAMGSVLYDAGGALFVDDPGQALYADTVIGPELDIQKDFSIIFWVKIHEDGVLIQFVDRIESTIISLGCVHW